MLKITSGFLVVLALLVSVGGASLAVFSDTATIEGQTISTAQVNISAHGESRPGVLPKPIQESGLVPGEWTNTFRGIVYNEANSTNVKVYMYITDLTGGACSKTNLYVATGNADGNEEQFTIYNAPIANIVGAEHKVELTGYIFVAPNWLPANTSLVMRQAAQLDPSAGNSFEGLNCNWNEVFYAESVIPSV